MNDESAVVVLAAGIGSRFGGPKQLAPLGPNGETFLDFSIHDALRAGFGKVVIVIRREMREAFESSIVARWSSRIAVELVYQEVSNLSDGIAINRHRTKPWGTAHAVLAAAELVSGAFAVINADDFYGAAAFTELSAFWRESVHDAVPVYAVIGFRLGNTLSGAGKVNRALLVIDENGWLQDIEEIIGIEQFGGHGRYGTSRGDLQVIPGDALISLNMWGFSREVFPRIDERFRMFLAAHGGNSSSEFLLPSVVGAMIHDGEARVKVISATGRTCGLTHPGDAPQAAATLRSLVEQGMYPRDLWAPA
jgi:hypothetical protein